MTAPITPEGIEELLSALNAKSLTRADDPSGYLRGYASLRTLFRTLDLSDPVHVIAGGYGVYGWMPTVLSRLPTDEAATRLGALAHHAAQAEALDDALGPLPADPLQRHRLLKAINGSVVGTSKFLHFAAPRIYPIWDSVVASVFQIKSWAVNRPETYLAYTRAIHGWIDRGGEIPVSLRSFAAEAHSSDEPLTDIRLVELGLFLAGKRSTAVPAELPE